jgi:CheY-specific phosphatase CheX
MSDLSKSLKTAIFNTMERMFFLLPDPDGESAGTSGGYSVSIGITGNPRYRLTLTFEPELAGAMAANALGMPSADTATLKKCILEATNVIAGNFLQHWDDSQGRNITLPSLTREGVFERFVPRETDHTDFTFEGMRLMVRVESDAQA